MNSLFSLTFPLVQWQVCVVHGLIVWLRLSLLLCISELTEERQVECLRGAHPLLGVQKQHLLQNTHCCDAERHVKVSMTEFSASIAV